MPLTRRGVLKATGILSAGGAVTLAPRAASATERQSHNDSVVDSSAVSQVSDTPPSFPLQFAESWSLTPRPSYPEQHVEAWSLDQPTFQLQYTEAWDVDIATFPLQHEESWSLDPPTFPLQHTEPWIEGPPIEPIDGTMPTDPDGDGLYEDINGDGEINFPDVNTFFQHADQPAITDHASYYDYTGDGAADLQDVLYLFGEV